MTNSSTYRIHHMHIKTSSNSVAVVHAATKYQQLVQYIAQRNWLSFFVHATIWLFLYFLPVLLFFAFNAGRGLSSLEPGNMVYSLTFIQVIIFSYLHYYWLTPWLFIQKKPLAYGFVVMGLIMLITGLQYLAEAAAAPPLTFLPALGFTFILLATSIFSALILQLYQKLVISKRALMKMNVSLLNTQVNPHFLFNSLNWIYLLAMEQSAATPDAITQLSGMMRYVVKEADADFIDLKKELQYINNYVLLQQGRLGNTVSINHSIPAFNGTGKIAPLLIMSFIENAFKHGIGPDEDSVISIDISITNCILFLHVINNKVFCADKPVGTGMGIYNAQQRLQLLYPGMHDLEILENTKIYSVKLSIHIL